MTPFNMENNIQELTFFKLQQQTQLLQQQNALLSAQLQLSRSHSLSGTNNNQTSTTKLASSTTKQPAQRSLSDLSSYYTSQQRSMDTIRVPPGLAHPTIPAVATQQSSLLLASLPQPPCISMQRRDSVKSDGSVPNVNDSTRYKTEMCRSYEETGHCRYGSKCQFAHGISELRNINRHPRYKTEFCRTFHTTGLCYYGQKCHFIHSEDERRPAPANQQNSMNNRPQALSIKHASFTSTNSSGSSPASSVYGDVYDMSPSHSPNFAEDVFTASTSSRLSPAPSLSSFTSDISSRSFPSPPSTPSYVDKFSSDQNLMTSSLDLSALLIALTSRQ